MSVKNVYEIVVTTYDVWDVHDARESLYRSDMDKAAMKNASKHSWSDVVDPLVPSDIRRRRPGEEYKGNM